MPVAIVTEWWWLRLPLICSLVAVAVVDKSYLHFLLDTNRMYLVVVGAGVVDAVLEKMAAVLYFQLVVGLMNVGGGDLHNLFSLTSLLKIAVVVYLSNHCL